MPRYPYSPDFEPPAAVVPLRIQRPHGESAVLVPALVDTGADVTVLPVGLAAQLRLPRIGRAALSGFDGTPRIVPLYAAHVRVANHAFTIETACHGHETLVGRDLLNRLVVRFDGPAGILEVQEPGRR